MGLLEVGTLPPGTYGDGMIIESGVMVFTLLIYLQKRGSLKGYVDLTKVKVIEKVLETAFDKPSFQVILYVCM